MPDAVPQASVCDTILVAGLIFHTTVAEFCAVTCPAASWRAMSNKLRVSSFFILVTVCDFV